jgi:hypothetical protein
LLEIAWLVGTVLKALYVGTNLVFSFLATDASPHVAPVHPDATPVLLLDENARKAWMSAP